MTQSGKAYELLLLFILYYFPIYHSGFLPFHIFGEIDFFDWSPNFSVFFKNILLGKILFSVVKNETKIQEKMVSNLLPGNDWLARLDLKIVKID